jgi:proteic killer suppression protein
VIKEFGDSETERIWKGLVSRKLPSELQPAIRRKLRMLHNAQDLDDLRSPPANRLERLKGELRDYYSIRINDQWRLIFKWNNRDAFDARVVDYHK